jgi:hypothetical protein
MERLNGEVRDREKVVRGVKKADSPLILEYQIYHNCVCSHLGLDGTTPAEKAGIEVKVENKWLTMIQNASKRKVDYSYILGIKSVQVWRVLLGKKVLCGLCVLLALGLFQVNMAIIPVYAVTITPNPAIAGQPITFSGASADLGGSIFSGFGCSGSVVGFVSTGGPGPYSYTLASGLPAGSYSVAIVDDIPASGCVNFTVVPATTQTLQADTKKQARDCYAVHDGC